MADRPAAGERAAFTARPRRRLTPAAADRHTQIVRALRLVVPAIGTGVLATYAVNAAPSEVDAEFLRQFSDISAQSEEMVLDRPRYLGQTLEGDAFEVSALRARRDPNAPDLLRFENPEALRGGGADGLRLRAAGGTLNTEENVALFDRDVELVQGIGGLDYTLETEAARLDIDKRVVSTQTGVRGRSEQGTVEAERLTVYQDEGRAVLEGGVRLRFEPSKRPDEGTTGDPAKGEQPPVATGERD